MGIAAIIISIIALVISIKAYKESKSNSEILRNSSK